MEHERWRRIEALYHSVLKLPAEQRVDFLESSCGEDTSLREEVGALVAREGEAMGFMEMPAFEVAARQIARDENKHETDLAEEFVPGNLLAGRYRIATLLGRGGMGAVYRVDDLDLGQVVALKFLPRAYSNDARRLEKFRGEVRNARRISHPSVCRVYDIHGADGLHFLTMEYIDGEDLSSLLRRIGYLPHDKALQIARQICAGLAAAHAKGVLHRDLKPANIMIDGQGHVRITDFGLAVNFDDVRELRETAGTPAYMAPEQLAGKPATVQSDLYSLGLVLYELYTGKTAFDTGSLTEWKQTRSQLGPAPPSARVGGFDGSVERAILQCLEQDPNKRPSSAMKVAAALPGGDLLAEAVAAGETPSPEMVAAAEEPALHVGTAWATLAGTFVLLISLALIANRSTLQGFVPISIERSVLIEHAEKIIQQAGYAGPFADHEEEFGFDKAALGYWTSKEPGNLRQVLNRYPGTVGFWYRVNVRPFRPLAPYGDVDFDDPPLEQGSARVWLTTLGRLSVFQAIPSRQEREHPLAIPLDSTAVLGFAGLRVNDLHPMVPNYVPSVPYDTRVAWEGVVDTVPLRVEAASLGGRLVNFMVTDQRGELSPEVADMNSRGFLFYASQLLMAALMAALGGIFAYRNVRKRRGDFRGAAVLSSSVFILAWLEFLGMEHAPSGIREVLNISMVNGAGFALFCGALVCIAYLAIEPFVRRNWPHLLISWSRIAAGNYRNPTMGRDLLLGVAAGCAAAFIVHAIHVFPPLTAPLQNYDPWFATARTFNAAGQFLDALRMSILFGIGGVFFLALAQRWLRNEALAILLAGVLLGAAHDPGGAGVWWLIYPASFAGVIICVMVGARLGLVSLVMALFTYKALAHMLSSFVWSDWSAVRPLMLLGIFAALAIYGFRIAVARPMLTTALDE